MFLSSGGALVPGPNHSPADRSLKIFVVQDGGGRGKRRIQCNGERTAMTTATLAPSSLVEALMFSLRRGTEAITEPDNQRRLAELSEDQLLAVCQRLQNFKPNIAPAWPPEEVEALASIWSTVHVSR